MSTIDEKVGHEVVETGIVTNSKHPYINGIGCWGLEDYRGKKVRVRGVLQKHVVTEDMIRPKDGVVVANEGAGVFYEIVQIIEVTEVK